jgi:hypothetical protein
MDLRTHEVQHEGFTDWTTCVLFLGNKHPRADRQGYNGVIACVDMVSAAVECLCV